ncbi:ABC transporter substrate-binding protein [Actinoallomurus spadix]|uniref:Protein kinase domain-containing protein n=1 Tax=Actinoallomurus spadix TaxID=79912 RepID=A0ABP3FUI5_9ACTN|nr:ABC transporter substrate-binding protein [Actinoallomurus spadix]MCO5986207.1 ABC transporter substrate-binding protein [Actinoallomurus spadix]
MPGSPLRAGDPERVGAYALTGRLGEGGQGVVYLGTAPDGGQVAVKLLHAQFSGDAKVRARFAGELTSAKRVAPFCTARILDADVEGDTPYLVSEFIDGPSLREVVDAEGPRWGESLQRLAIGTVTALAAIHEAGIVHRDFKPSNVLLASDGPRVIDFGIARALDATGTLSSTAVGTPSYMSPEQISGQVVGPATDVFAWACTIVFAATGSPAFGQDSIPAVMNRVLHQEPYLGMLTGPLREIVAACLAKEPGRRPTTQQILLRLLSHEGVVLPGTGAPAPTTMLQEGAQVAAEGAPSGGWVSPGSSAPAGDVPPPGPYAAGGDTPPPGPSAPAGDTPPRGLPGPGATPYGRWPDPGPYGPPSPYAPHRPGGGLGTVPYPPAGAAQRRIRPRVVAAIAAGAVVMIATSAMGVYRAIDGYRTHSGPGPTHGPVGRVGGGFRMAMYAPEAIDPSNAVLTSDVFVAENLFTGLTRIKPDGSLAKALATEMTPGAGCTQWHFTIRQGTTFTDGNAVDAAAFVRGWNRAARGKGMGYLMTGIQGYADVAAGRRATMSGVVAEGSTGLRVTLAKPDCDFAMRAATPPFAPVPPSAGDPGNTAFNDRPIGNGPFKIGGYTASRQLSLVRNDSYAFARPKLDTVDVAFVSDLDQALAGFDGRRYDWVQVDGAATIASALARHTTDHKLIQVASTTMTYLTPITDQGPMKSKEARLAVSYALNRKDLATALGPGYTPATSLVAPAVPGAYVGGCTACAFDAAQARSLATRAGMGAGTKVTLTTADLPAAIKVMTLVQNQLKAVLGWDVQVRRLRTGDFYEDMSGKNPQGLYRLSWAADYPSAANVLDSLLSSDAIQRKGDGSTSGSNYARYRNPAFDAAMNAARATQDQTQRTERLHAAEKIALDDMAMIPLCSHPVYRVADTASFVGMDLDYTGFPVLTTTAHV